MNPKIIVSVAITGAVHTPTMSPYLPITPEQIADEAVRAWEAGATVAHIHVRDPETGAPSREIELYRDVASRVKSKCDLILCMTTGAGIGATVEERLGPVIALKPELATFNFGSMNFGLFPIAENIDSFKFDWERPYLANTEDYVFPNSFKMLKEFGKIFEENGTRPEMEVYDISMLNNVAFLVGRKCFKTPVYVQYVLGILGGMPASAKNLMFLNETATAQLSQYHWSVCAAGRHQMQLGALSAMLGGNVRVGLEDNLYIEKGKFAKSNAEQVEKIIRILREFGAEPATPQEGREILDLKGIDKVNW